MKSKVLLSMLVVALSVALIAGGTGAWFTAEDNMPTANFQAGTLEINVDEGEEFITTPVGKYFDNVNPGDCATVTWEIFNTGTKAAELRAKLDMSWSEGLSTDNIRYAPKKDSGWVMYEDMNGIWFYYTGGSVRGTYNPDGEEPLAPESVTLPLVIAFDGEETDDDYQGEAFTLSGKVYAVQASNDAPTTVWGDGWTKANAARAAGSFYVNEGSTAVAYASYFTEGPGATMDCWIGGNGEAELFDLITTVGWYENGVFIEDNSLGTISANPTSPQAANVVITLTNNANDDDAYKFLRWEAAVGDGAFETIGTPQAGEPINGTDYILNYTMPASDVIIRAIWDGGAGGNQPVTYKLTTLAVVEAGGSVTAGNDYTEGTPITLTAVVNEGYSFTGWSGHEAIAGASVDGATLTFNMPAGAVTITANFELIPVPDQYTLSLVQFRKLFNGPYESGSFGTVTGAGTYDVGSDVILTATNSNWHSRPGVGYGYWNFTGWYKTMNNGTGGGNRLSTDHTYTYNNDTAADGSTVVIYAGFEWKTH